MMMKKKPTLEEKAEGKGNKRLTTIYISGQHKKN